MEQKKITKTEYFEMIKAELVNIEGKEDLIAFVDTQIEQIAAKAQKAKERAAEKKADGDELRESVRQVLTSEYQNIDAIMGSLEETGLDMTDISRAKVSARLTQLVKAGMVEKEQQKAGDRKTMHYRLIAVAE